MVNIIIGNKKYKLKQNVPKKVGREKEGYEILVNNQKTGVENVLVPIIKDKYPYEFEKISKTQVTLKINHTDNPVVLNGQQLNLNGRKKLIDDDSEFITGDFKINILIAD